jgi:hypothetical protein
MVMYVLNKRGVVFPWVNPEGTMHAGLGSEGTPPCELPPMRRKYARHVSGWACEDEQRVNDGNRFQPDKAGTPPSRPSNDSRRQLKLITK